MNSSIIYLRKIPFKVTVRKLVNKLMSKLRGGRSSFINLNSSTYQTLFDTKYQFLDDLFSFSNIHVDQTEYFNNSLILQELRNDSLNHIISVFGRKIKLDYSTYADGFEDDLYDNRISFDFFKVYISKYINQSNIKDSTLISELLDSDYINIDWQRDYLSGFRWSESQWHTKISYGNISGADIKVPWEIGRMQNLPQLAYLAFFDHNNADIYFKEFQNQVIDFIASNPPGFGTQWMTSMDIALRAINWTFTYSLFKSLNYEADHKFINVLNNSLDNHLYLILNNLEWSEGMRGNHYLADICGLLFISFSAKSNSLTDSVLAFSINELIIEIYHQFNNDGSNFEASTAYHSFTFEMIFLALYIIYSIKQDRFEAIINNLDTDELSNLTHSRLIKSKMKHLKYFSYSYIRSESFLNHINNIFEFYKINIINPEFYNKIGDNDSGYVINTDSFNMLSDAFIRSFPKRHNINYNKYNHLVYLFNNSELFNLYLSKIHTKSKLQNSSNFQLKAYPDFGLYVLSNDIYKVFFRAGNIGQNGKGGHSHNDQLSVNISVNDIPLFVDAGTYCYTSNAKLRNKYRSVNSHNTLVINGKEQNKWLNNNKNDLFWIAKEKTKSKIINTSNESVSAEHYAYNKKCTRTVILKNHQIEIIDSCKAKGIKCVLFHLHNECKAEFVNNSQAIILLKDSINIEIDFSGASDIYLKDYFYSPEYAQKVKSKVIIVELSGNNLTTLIKYSNSTRS